MLSLSRRGSSAAVTTPSKTLPAYTGSLRLLASSQQSPRFPLEIFDRIIQCYVDGHAITAVRLTLFANLRLCSRAFNQSTLRHAFDTVFIGSGNIWNGVADFLQKETDKGALRNAKAGFAWVRNMVISGVHCILRNPQHFAHFDALSFLSLDFEYTGLNTQFETVRKIFGAFGDEPSSAAPAPNTTPHGISESLEHLKITKLPAIDLHLLNYIVRLFPNLVSLELESTSRLNLDCCTVCLQDSLTVTMHSPVSRRFLSAEDLALNFGEALKPLTSLKTLYLGCFLSPEEFIETHVAHHCDTDDAFRDANILYQARREMLDSISKMPTCIKCRKAGLEDIQYQELVASLRIAQYVKSLERIAWDTCCGRPIGKKAAKAQLEETSEGGRGVVLVNEPELKGGACADSAEEEAEEGSSQRSGGTGSESSGSDEWQSQLAGYSDDFFNDGGDGQAPRTFKIDMKVIRENKRVRVRRLDSN